MFILFYFQTPRMPLFDAFRHKPGPTLYDPFKTAVTADVLEVGFIYAAVIVFFSLIAIIPGVRGRELIYTCIRILFGVFITAGMQHVIINLKNLVYNVM